jgi:enoyl-CoA hydratase/carnithine racemase
MDFSFFLGTEAGGLSAEEAVKAYSGLLTRMRVSAKPVIALVDGDVKAGGIGLVAAADIVIASTRSQFQLSEVLLGLIPANVLPFLIERVGQRRATWMTLTARTLDAASARAAGLVDEVFEVDTLEKDTRGFMRTLMRADPYALAATKRFVAEIGGLQRDEAALAAARSLLELAARPEVRYAVAAFEDGGLPAWSLRFKPENDLWIGEKNDE